MKRFVFLLIGIMMVGGIAAAEAGPTVAGDDSTVETIIPTESIVVVPVIEKPVEVAFDVEGTEITAVSELEAIDGAREVRENPNEGRYTEKESQKEKNLDREWKRERAGGLVTQADLGERAVANWDQACKFLTLVSGPQLDS